MIIIKLIEALQEQILFCEGEYNYRCGVYVATEENKDIVMKIFNDLYPLRDREIEVRNNNHESFIGYPNGNVIRIMQPSSSVRGQRFNGVIIDSNINQEVINTIILPHLMPLRLINGMYDSNDNPRHREFHCSISKNDLIEFENYMTKMLKEQRKILENLPEFVGV